MPAQFSSLPWELRHQIYDRALDRSPRNVEVEVRSGKVVPKTPPPALLHLNRESRNFVLSIYKPWLPQFAGSPVQAPYAALLESNREVSKYRLPSARPVSCLDDVCFDMERDTLFCRSMFISPQVTSGWPIHLFGRIEETYLREMTINIEGHLDIKNVVSALMVASNLRTLWCLDMRETEEYDKVDQIRETLRRMGKIQAKRGSRMTNPTIMAAPTSYFLPEAGPNHPLQWHVCPSGRSPSPDLDIKSEFEVEHQVPSKIWTTYKYPPPRFANPHVDVPIRREFNPRKRKANKDLDAAMAAEAADRANRVHIWIRSDELASMSEETKRQLGIVERPASPISEASSRSPPDSEASDSDSHSEASSSHPASDAGSAHDEDENSEASDSESDDEALDKEAASQERTPREIHAHRFNYDIGASEILVEWENSPDIDAWEWVPKADLLPIVPVMIATLTANLPALERGTPVRFHERNSGAVGFDFLVEFENYPEEIYWTWVPETHMQARVPAMVDQWMIENASEVNADENVDEQILAEQNYAENVRAEEEVKEEVKVEEEAPTIDTEMKDEEREENKELDDGEPAEYVPKRFVAQRETPDGPEILVEWEDWPDEKDYTWEPVSNLQEDAPEMMKAWKASRKPKKVLKVYEVESILGKRKVKGEWHYLVKWKGFSKDDAKSLEPCEKLAVDVPKLVEAFENRKSRRGRPKRAVGA